VWTVIEQRCEVEFVARAAEDYATPYSGDWWDAHDKEEKRKSPALSHLEDCALISDETTVDMLRLDSLPTFADSKSVVVPNQGLPTGNKSIILKMSGKGYDTKH